MNPLRILHLEDNPIDGELIQAVLAAEWPGCTVHRVETREEFIAALAEPHELVLSDFSLPQFDGMTALDLVRSRDPLLPFIFMSGTIGEENAVRAMQRGATDYVIKDRPARLVSTVRRALAEAQARRERQRTEERLRDLEERFSQLAMQSADVFWFVDVEPESVAYISPAYETVWGRTPDELKTDARAWCRHIDPRDRERVERSYQAVVRGEKSRFEEEYRVRRPDGSERWILDSGALVRSEDGRAIRLCGIAKDITEKQRLTEQLLRSQRIESLGTLAGGIAHDLNNVLAPIMMAAALAQSRTTDPDIQRLMGMIDQSARHGADLVKQVLKFARGAESERTPVQLDETIDSVVSLLRETLPRSIAIEAQLESPLPVVSADTTKINQVLMNLCVNARDAMPQGGRLTVRASGCDVAEAQASAHNGAGSGAHLRITVEDTGTGIAPEHLPRILEPFFTTKPAGTGTGLGLATVADIVREHGGFLEIDSALGRGTAFRIYLPADPQANAPATPVASAPAVCTGPTGTVLIIDDEATLREVMRAYLESRGFRVIVAEDGIAGVASFRAHHGEIQAVVTDLMMPLLQGEQVIAELKAIDPAVGIVAVTGVLHPNALQDQRGVIVLHKPVSGDELVRALVRLSARKTC